MKLLSDSLEVVRVVLNSSDSLRFKINIQIQYPKNPPYQEKMSGTERGIDDILDLIICFSETSALQYNLDPRFSVNKQISMMIDHYC